MLKYLLDEHIPPVYPLITCNVPKTSIRIEKPGSMANDNMNKPHQPTINFRRIAAADFSRGFKSTERDNTIHPVASATVETCAAMIQPSLTRRRILSRHDRALKRTAKFIAPLRGEEVAA
jgi:hypothetical protein